MTAKTAEDQDKAAVMTQEDGVVQPSRTSAVEALSVSVQFGGVRALDDVSLRVAEGEIHGLIGPNGAGKSTLVNVVAGEQRPTSGRVLLAGEDVTGSRPQHIARRGLARTFQHPQLAGRLTVGENLDMSRRFARSRASTGATPHEQWAAGVLAEMELETWLDVLCSQAPYPVLKVADTVRALLTRPKVLLSDEPAAGLPADDRAKLVDVLRSAQSELDTTIVLIEHDVPLVFSVCSRITVLDSGKVVTSGASGEVQKHPEVIKAYLGVET
ncbi:ABC transporter ATP-binding protein [Nocardioides halotolerans]|uniref:ABC transporter ATP-binding protein n=1 Tax=Nocardioides halotolerans TaxID=433660 RepID=UPI000409F428|nr:ATP-binding cassette domain-containing protein [Nocardioides halotolerans]